MLIFKDLALELFGKMLKTAFIAISRLCVLKICRRPGGCVIPVAVPLCSYRVCYIKKYLGPVVWQRPLLTYSLRH
jgi:hypothetical protein